MPLPPANPALFEIPAPNDWEKPSFPDGQPILIDPAVKSKWSGIDDSYVVRAKILSERPDGYIEFPLWLKTDVADMPDFPVVESVTVEWGPGVSGQITVTMKMDYAMGRWFLDNELSRYGNILVVQAGWPKANNWTPVFSGYMEAPQPSHDPMGYDITLRADITGMRLGKLRYNMGEYIKGKSSRRAVLRDFLEKAGFGVYFVENPYTAREEDNEWLDSGIETALVAGGRFWPEEHSIESFINWVCLEANMKCIMWPHPQTGEVYAFTFMNRESVMSQEVTRELVLFADVNVEKGIYPLIGFSSENPMVFQDRWMLGAVAADIDPITKNFVQVEASDLTSKMPSHGEENAGVRADAKWLGPAFAPYGVVPKGLGAAFAPYTTEFAEEKDEEGGSQAMLTTKSGRPMLFEEGTHFAPGGVQVASPVGRDSSEEGRLQSFYEDSAMRGGIGATLKTIGMPDAHPEMLIGVRRVGTRFDGIYKINKITHTLSAGTWDTDFDALKSDFAKGSGLLKSSRPVIPQEIVENSYPKQIVDSEQAGESQSGEEPPEAAL